jgi:hypothetical protein
MTRGPDTAAREYAHCALKQHCAPLRFVEAIGAPTPGGMITTSH